MAGPLLADRIKETSTTTGTGTFTLAGAATGFRAFSTFADADTVFYVIVAVNGSGAPTGAWEVGIGTVGGTGTTLARTTVLSSSNAGAAVNFGAGTKHVFCDEPADSSAALKQYAGLGIGTAGVAGTLAFGSSGTVTVPTGGYLQVTDGTKELKVDFSGSASIISTGELGLFSSADGIQLSPFNGVVTVTSTLNVPTIIANIINPSGGFTIDATSGTGDITLVTSGAFGAIQLTATDGIYANSPLIVSGAVSASGFTGPVVFPTSDPLIADAWWNNAGTLTISAGP